MTTKMSDCRHDDATTHCATCGRTASLGELDTARAEVERLRAENHKLGSLVADARRLICPEQHREWEESAAGWQCECEAAAEKALAEVERLRAEIADMYRALGIDTVMRRIERSMVNSYRAEEHPPEKEE